MAFNEKNTSTADYIMQLYSTVYACTKSTNDNLLYSIILENYNFATSQRQD